ncbi:Helitron helicase [Phytophthora megakarya]|uniref:Helitron helicase n=1 Tax=Phytophthora megakarya TaxID=4795 RepID=A0A225VNX1_9STRA|nr:Helitron helicase [Phytophthora megakarya]
MPYALRQLFGTILVYSLPDHAPALWDRFKKDFSEYYFKSIAERDRQNNIEREEEVRLRMAEYRCLKFVAEYLLSDGKTLDMYGLPELSTYRDVWEEVEREDTHHRDVVANEITTFEPDDLAKTTALADQMNENQKEVFDQVTEAVNHPVGGQKLFFVDGPEVPLDEGNNNPDDDRREQNVNALIDAVYRGVGNDNLQDEYSVDRAILAPSNARVRRINGMVMERLTGETIKSLSVDSLEGVADPNMFEQQFLNSLNFSGIPPHRIVLKVGTPIIMIRNLNSDPGLEDDDKAFPFKLQRKQFPVVPAFAMMINKDQGQVTSRKAIKIAVDPSAIDENGNIHTKNIVYREIFDL